MEKVITLLYDIEEKANRILKHANEEKASLYEEMNQKIEQADAEIQNETQKKLEQMKKKFDQNIADETNALIESSEKHLHEIEVLFNHNHDALVQQIFDQIIKE